MNFSESVDFDQLKGRVFEAINCGAVLLDSINSPISKYFEDKKHFVSYKDEITSICKFNYYSQILINTEGLVKKHKFF